MKLFHFDPSLYLFVFIFVMLNHLTETGNISVGNALYIEKIYILIKFINFVNLDHNCSLLENLKIKTIANNSNCHGLIFTGNPFLL